MAINFSLSQMKLPADVRKASKNGRPKGTGWASGRTYLVEARREAPGMLPWATPRPQVIPVRARDRRAVEAQLRRDGWTTRVRRMPRGWVPR